MIKHPKPDCIVCGKPVNLPRNKTCSIECRTIAGKSTSEARQQKQKATLFEKYGVTNIRNIPGAEEKRLDTLFEKYGSGLSPKGRQAAKDRSDDLILKGRKTLKEKYGVDNPGQLKDHREKCLNTQTINYGEGLYYGSDEFKAKSLGKRLEKYNSLCPIGVTFLEISEPDRIKQEIFNNPNKLISFVCNNCNKSESLPSETFKWRIRNLDTPCTECCGLHHGSNKEGELKSFIRDELQIPIIENAKVLVGKREIDVYVPSLRIGFEFNGLYWHNDLRRNKYYHKQKQLEAKNNGIQLIHIFEDDWDHRQEIVKSRIRNILGVIPQKYTLESAK